MDWLLFLPRLVASQSSLLDNDPNTGGGADGDILNDEIHNALLRRVAAGEFAIIMAAPPCSTFSIARHFAAEGSGDDGPPIVRDRNNIRGLSDVPKGHRRELLRANAIYSVTHGRNNYDGSWRRHSIRHREPSRPRRSRFSSPLSRLGPWSTVAHAGDSKAKGIGFRRTRGYFPNVCLSIPMAKIYHLVVLAGTR